MLRARPIIATPDGVVVAGNMRLRAAKAIGMETVPVFLAELDDGRRREWMLRDNAQYGDWVPDRLAELVALHEREGGDVGLLGLSAQEASDMQALEERSNASGLDEPEAPGGAIEPRFAVVVECADRAPAVAPVGGDRGPRRELRRGARDPGLMPAPPPRRRYSAYDSLTEDGAATVAARLGRRVRAAKKVVRGRPAWRGAERERKRATALAACLGYLYLSELLAVMAEHAEWATIGEIPAQVRDAAAIQAGRQVSKVV